MTLTPHFLLVLWSWKGRAIPLLPLWAIWPVQSLDACRRVHFTFFAFYQYSVPCELCPCKWMCLWHTVDISFRIRKITCRVHSGLMDCNSNVGTQYHGIRVGAPEGPLCHAYGNVDRNRVSWKLGLLWLMITRAFLLVLSLLLLITETSWSMDSILPCLVSDHVLYGQDHYYTVLVVMLPT